MQRPTFKEALRFWFKLGWISFGGPAGQIAIMHEFLVDKKRWISEKKFLHALNYCMLLPGPEAQQLATYTGWLLHGKKGGLAAGLLFILPSVIVLLILSILYVKFGKIAWVYAVFNGLKPAVVAIVILALIKMSKRTLQHTIHYIIALLSFCAIFFFKLSFILVILAAACFGLLYLFNRWQGKPAAENTNTRNNKQTDDEKAYFLTTKSEIPGTGFHAGGFLKQVGIFILLWFVPLTIFYYWNSEFTFWKDLSMFFTQSAFITFGGAYAVLHYVSTEAVETYRWLSSLQMIDGLALGETTPGPLIMVLAFTGFMGAYHHFDNTITAGVIGLITTTYYTFLPSFLFIFVGAPIIEKTQQNTFVKMLFQFITAAVVGAVMNLTMYFAEVVLFGVHFTSFNAVTFQNFNVINLVWILISVLAMYKYKVGMIAWIGVSALFGIVVFLLGISA